MLLYRLYGNKLGKHERRQILVTFGISCSMRGTGFACWRFGTIFYLVSFHIIAFGTKLLDVQFHDNANVWNLDRISVHMIL